jgi:antibiotic biosynthesis monooxygenase (ABM) superfamily enzyme
MSGVVYEVSVEVDASIRADYLQWLEAHVAEILALPGFTGADVFEVVDPAAGDALGVCMQYRLVDADALATYLREHAPRLRADGVARFGTRMRARRRVMRPLRAN